MDVSNAVRQHVEEKVAKLPRFYDNIQTIEVKLDNEADKSVVEIIAHAKKKHTFIAHHRDENLYSSLDMCMEKITEQLRRHKDKVRDRQGPTHDETAEAFKE